MKTSKISYRNANYFSGLICDYIEDSEKLSHLHSGFPDIKSFEKQMSVKSESYPASQRTKLVEVLLDQYKGMPDAELTLNNIQKLSSDKAFTITTGHQLNLFTGPLYFLYKIISVINLCEQLKQSYPENEFVPIYWMATEDHDFEEIQSFKFKGKKLSWDREASGAVGRLSTDGLEVVLDQLKSELGNSENAAELLQLFQSAYLEHDDLAAATRFLAHQLFHQYGLVIIDADDHRLKQMMIPYFEDELINKSSFDAVNETLSSWPEEYKIQVNPREINLFYPHDGIRERIVYQNGVYQVVDTTISFSRDEILVELQQHPERFSPNVILRPFYQEVILPNLCYVGGGGELAYWLELKKYFDHQSVPFPLLLPRNSALLLTEKQLNKVKKLDLTIDQLFLEPHELEEYIVKQLSEINIDFSKQRDHLKKQFVEMYEIAKKTDVSFKGAVAAQEQKQINGLNHLEKRLLKAQKRKLSDFTNRALLLQEQLFPNHSLQERQENFSSFYLDHGAVLIEHLKGSLNPLDVQFSIIVLDN